MIGNGCPKHGARAAIRHEAGTSMILRDEFDNLFSSQRPIYSLSNKLWNPPTDIYETPEATCIKIEAAGLEKSEIQVIVQRNFLVVRGQRRPFSEPRKVVYHLMEVRYDQFERVFEFSHPIDEDKARVTYAQGFLLIEIQKAPDAVTQVTVQLLDDLPQE
jgi:HSP20 family protein